METNCLLIGLLSPLPSQSPFIVTPGCGRDLVLCTQLLLSTDWWKLIASLIGHLSLVSSHPANPRSLLRLVEDVTQNSLLGSRIQQNQLLLSTDWLKLIASLVRHLSFVSSPQPIPVSVASGGRRDSLLGSLTPKNKLLIG